MLVWTDRVWACTGLSASEKLVALRIADRVNMETGTAWPGVRSIAKDCGLTKAGVMKLIARLLDLGVLVVVAEASGKTPRTYRFDADRLIAVNGIDRKKQHRSAPRGQCHRPQQSSSDSSSGQYHCPQGEPVAVNAVSVAVNTDSPSGQCHRPKPLEPLGTEILTPAAPAVAEAQHKHTRPGQAPPWRVYVAVATKALDTIVRRNPDPAIGDVVEAFKTACAQERMPYTSDLARKACEAATYNRNKKRDQFFQNARSIGVSA